MPNFAEQYPFVIFLPVVVFAAIALGAGLVHLAVMLDAQLKRYRKVTPAALPIQIAVTPATILAAIPIGQSFVVELKRSARPRQLATEEV